MKKATITALKKSIKVWERRAAGENIQPNQANCPLCVRFDPSRFIFECHIKSTGERCPVYAKTGRRQCKGSNYFAFASYWEIIANKPKSKRLKALAQKEVDFLKSLLPNA